MYINPKWLQKAEKKLKRLQRQLSRKKKGSKKDLQVKNMMKNHKLAKSIANAGWGMLDKYLQYKAEREGKIFIKVNAAYTSQRCSRCGRIVEKDGSARSYAYRDCVRPAVNNSRQRSMK